MIVMYVTIIACSTSLLGVIPFVQSLAYNQEHSNGNFRRCRWQSSYNADQMIKATTAAVNELDSGLDPIRNSNKLPYHYFKNHLHSSTRLYSSSSSSSSHTNNVKEEESVRSEEDEKALGNNKRYINTLLSNLQKALDDWFTTGSPNAKEQILQLMDMIHKTAKLEEDWHRAIRMAKRATFEIPARLSASDRDVNKDLDRSNSSKKVLFSAAPNFDGASRRSEAQTRKDWESKFHSIHESSTLKKNKPRSALSERVSNAEAFMSSLERQSRPSDSKSSYGMSSQKIAEDKDALERALSMGRDSKSEIDQGEASQSISNSPDSCNDDFWASNLISTIVAKSGPNFTGAKLGIGGLDDVLDQIKRRIWVPLAAPPQLLQDLGIQPVRGLLLYGAPGCGKTLLARKLGSILSPMRPITLISGPEIMDKYVGSSEANLREVFDNPPPIYESIVHAMLREEGISNENDALAVSEALDMASLHVIVMDEFDAMARARGGSGGSNSQGDAGVARDSLVNQMLAKMDGVDALPRPTLVIGLTNKRDLIEPALLRSGRFEVQIEVPPPNSVSQRVAILKIHTQKMFNSGRLLVRDVPHGTPAANYIKDTYSIPTSNSNPELLLIPSYNELLEILASKYCVGYSGANLAGVCRAAASHALERAVANLADSSNVGNDGECLVTIADFELAVKDVNESMSLKDSDQTESSSEDSINSDEIITGTPNEMKE